jgi:hypothetical protein
MPHLVAVYTAGYVFGRSGWGPGASFYSLRFGPRRQVHGHDDHMSLIYYARGRNLIVNAGHTGYENTPYRAYLRSPEASSMLVMPRVPFDPFAPTSLVSDQIGRYGQFYEFFDTAFGGHPRYRSVYVSQRPDLVLVFDRAWGSGEYQQLWHLDPALRVTRLGSSGDGNDGSYAFTRRGQVQVFMPNKRPSQPAARHPSWSRYSCSFL